MIGVICMDNNHNQLEDQGNQNLKAGILARGLQVLLMFSVIGLELFFGSGTITWTWAWVFLGIGLLSVAINSFIMLRNSPETVAERGRPKETQTWDKWVSGVWLLGQYFALPLVAALDNRFSWTGDLSPLWHWVGAITYALSLGLSSWAMISNAFFSTAVRLQDDRGQQVCRTGPYRYVRHPGYVGFFLQAVCAPLLLGSLWALIISFPAGISMLIRTSLEDRMLQEQLLGYKAYTKEVRYRLLPGIW
jgi:protein-S-isoprenylcysteine O-methyltransferase Ste14